MRLCSAFVAALALTVSASAAAACELSAGDAARFPLQTRKPVIGADVHRSSGFGIRLHPILQVARLHTGVDWAAPTGTPVIAAGAGRVVAAEAKAEYGNA